MEDIVDLTKKKQKQFDDYAMLIYQNLDKKLMRIGSHKGRSLKTPLRIESEKNNFEGLSSQKSDNSNENQSLKLKKHIPF